MKNLTIVLQLYLLLAGCIPSALASSNKSVLKNEFLRSIFLPTLTSTCEHSYNEESDTESLDGKPVFRELEAMRLKELEAKRERLLKIKEARRLRTLEAERKHEMKLEKELEEERRRQLRPEEDQARAAERQRNERQANITIVSGLIVIMIAAGVAIYKINWLEDYSVYYGESDLWMFDSYQENPSSSFLYPSLNFIHEKSFV